MTYIPLWITVLTCTLKQTISFSSYCDCNPRADHPQNHYCRVDYVIKAIILSKIEEINEISTDEFSHHNDIRFKAIKYTVRVLEIFKYEAKHSTPSIGSVIQIWTVPFCPAFFPVHATHLIMGSVRKGYLETTYCEWSPPFLSLYDEQIAGLRKDYGKNCKCMVKFCDYAPKSGLCTYNPKKQCLLRWDFPSSFQGQCYISYSYCRRKKRKCFFKENNSLNTCVQYLESLIDSFDEKYGEQETTVEPGSGYEGSGSGDDGDPVIITTEQAAPNSLDE